MKRLLLPALFHVICISYCAGQLDTIHWLPPMHCREDFGDHYLYLSTPETTPFDVTIEDSNGMLFRRVRISNANPARVDIGDGLPTKIMINEQRLNRVLADRGFIIHGPRAFYANFRANSYDTFHSGSLTCKGRVAAGTEFRTGHLYSTYGYDRCHFIGIMATEDNTQVTVSNLRPGLTLAGPGGGNPGGTVTFNLPVKGRSYVISTYSDPGRPQNDEGFLGTHILSDKPVVVSTGSWKGSPIAGGRDIGIDQIVPVDVVGDEYIVIRGNGPDVIERPIIVAAYDDTEVYLNCGTSPAYYLDAGEYVVLEAVNYSAEENMYIRTSQPVYIYQHLGGLPSSVTSGMNFIPPLSCLIPKKADNIPYFTRIGDREFDGYVLIVAQSGHPVTLNGVPLSLADAKPVPCNLDYVTFKIPSEEVIGIHASVFSTGSVQVALLGGSVNAGWAGYFAGFARKPDIDLMAESTSGGNACPDTLFAPGIYDEIEWYYNGVLDTSIKENYISHPPAGDYHVVGYFSNCKEVQDTSAVRNIPVPDSTYLDLTSCLPRDTGYTVETFVNNKGCDSTVFTKVTLLPSHEIQLFETSCSPLDTGTFVQILQNKYGCDSTVTTEVNLLPSHEKFLYESSCNPQDTGVFVQNLTNGAGCDSVVTRIVELLPKNQIQLTEMTCQPQDTGTFIQALQNQYGCDSIVITRVNLLPSHDLNFFETSCSPLDTGVFIQVLQNRFGCDSIVTTEIDLLPSHTLQLSETSCSPLDTGTFVQILQNRHGCDSIVTTEVKLLPSHDTQLFETSCNAADTGLFVQVLPNIHGCDSIVTTEISLLPSHETRLFEASCNPVDTGTFFNLQMNRFGCDSMVITRVDFTPIDTLQLPDENRCKNNIFTIWGEEFTSPGAYCRTFNTPFGCDSTVCFKLEYRDTAIARQRFEICAGDTIRVGTSKYAASGTYHDLFNKTNGCDSLVITELKVNQNPVPLIEGETIYCEGDSVHLSANEVYAWQTWLPTGSHAESIFRKEESVIILEVTDANGCNGVDTFYLPPPIRVEGEIIVETDYNGYEVSCHDSNDGIVSASATGGIEPYRFSWGNAPAAPRLTDLYPGEYQLTIADAAGCTWTEDVTLQAPPPTILELTGEPALCFGESNGSIIVTRSEGGVGDFRYAIGSPNGSFTSDELFKNLSAGAYTIWMRDANGCLTSESFIVREPPPLTVSLGPDQVLNLGDGLELSALISRYYETIEWFPADFLDCIDCEAPFSLPLEDIVYQVVVEDENGCRAEDEIFLRVNTDYDVYIPSAFSPNDDGINDFFTVFASENVEEVETLQIFSRWGEKVFEGNSFPPNIENLGWDGVFRDEKMQPAVFAYFARVRYINGHTELFKGDFTLVK